MERLRLADPAPRQVHEGGAAGVCHSDLHIVKGEWARRHPQVLGHEGSGIVEEVGAGVESLEVGDHVVLSWTPYCGACPQCLRGRYVCASWRRRTNNLLGDGQPRRWRGDEAVHAMGGLGTFGEQTVVPETGAVRIDRSLPLDVAALVGCAVMTGVGSVLNTAAVEPGATVVVVGCGGVGLSAIQGAVLVAAAPDHRRRRVDAKLDLARQLGATPRSTRPASASPRRSAADRRPRRAVRVRGDRPGETIEAAYESLDARGRRHRRAGTGRRGISSTRARFRPGEDADRLQLRSARPALDFPRLLGWYAAGQLNLIRWSPGASRWAR